MKIINTTYGYRTENNGKIIYSSSSTDEGLCYKDETAWDSGKGICYIPEYDFLDDSNVRFEDKEYSEDLGYTKETMIDEVQDYLNSCYDCNDRQLATNIAEYVFQELNWQSVGTFLEECSIGMRI